MSNSSFTPHYDRLPDSIKNLVNRVVQELSPEEVILFGSRTRGDHRENSDFDIAVKSSSIKTKNWSQIQLALDEEPITLYQVDLVDFGELKDQNQKQILSNPP